MEADARQAFLEARRSCIGGSDWSSILGLPGAYDTPLGVWRSKVDPLSDEDDQTYQQARGDALEPFVCEWFGRVRDETVHRDPIPEEAICRTLPAWWKTQVDAVVLDDGHPIPLEAKTATLRKSDEWGESGTDQVPLRYVVQLMAQVAYLGAPYGYLAVDIGGDNFRWYRLERDDDLIAHMLKKGTEFWALVESGTPPHPSTSAEANIVWKTHEPGEYLEADPATLALHKELCDVKAESKSLAGRQDEIEMRLKARMEFREGIRSGDAVLCTWKTQESKRLDTTALKKAAPDVAEKFTKITTSRVLRVNGQSDE